MSSEINVGKDVFQFIFKESHLTIFPNDVFIHFLCNWLSIEDIGRLDSSFCNHEERCIFLTSLRLHNSLFERKDIKCSSNDFLIWLILRGLSVKRFSYLIKGRDQNVDDLIAFAICNPELLEFNLRTHGFMRPSSLNKITNFWPNLHHISLGNGSNITDATVKHLAQDCPQLKSIELSRCFNLTDKAITAFVQGCQKLESIYLDGSTSPKILPCDYVPDLPALQYFPGFILWLSGFIYRYLARCFLTAYSST
eukprot:gene3378-6696_t